MEYFDIVDENGIPTGEIVERSVAHANGIRHRTAHIWIVRREQDRLQALLQKRAMNKDSFPGCYDTSSSGHIQAGDEPKESARRELFEELGIEAKEDELIYAGYFHVGYEKEFYGKLFRDNEYASVYVYCKPVEMEKLVLQKEELDGVAWFDLEEIQRKISPRDPLFCVPSAGFEIARKWCEDNL